MKGLYVVCQLNQPRRKKFTLKKLIEVAVSQLCPGGKPQKPAPRDGTMEVVVELPCCNGNDGTVPLEPHEVADERDASNLGPCQSPPNQNSTHSAPAHVKSG